MSAYRFCRTDDIELLVDAVNRCWAPYFPDEPLMTPAAFKRSIRDLQVWCSSCMVAFEGHDPIGVLIGAKRSSGTLVHRIAVRPDCRRRGHGRHMLTSLGSKLAILGPPRVVAEVPAALDAAISLFSACGYAEEVRLRDYVLEWNGTGGSPVGAEAPEAPAAGFVVPVTVDDLVANDLLGEPEHCWERSVETLTATRDQTSGLAIASDERIEAFVLYIGRGDDMAEITSLRSLVDDGGVRVKQLLSRVHHRGIERFRFAKVHPAEISTDLLESLGFHPRDAWVCCTKSARAPQ